MNFNKYKKMSEKKMVKEQLAMKISTVVNEFNDKIGKIVEEAEYGLNIAIALGLRVITNDGIYFFDMKTNSLINATVDELEEKQE